MITLASLKRQATKMTGRFLDMFARRPIVYLNKYWSNTHMINLTDKEKQFLAGDLNLRFDTQEEFTQTMERMVEAGLVETVMINNLLHYQFTSIGWQLATQLKKPSVKN
jgi:hypothetical protein